MASPLLPAEGHQKKIGNVAIHEPMGEHLSYSKEEGHQEWSSGRVKMETKG